MTLSRSSIVFMGITAAVPIAWALTLLTNDRPPPTEDAEKRAVARSTASVDRAKPRRYTPPPRPRETFSSSAQPVEPEPETEAPDERREPNVAAALQQATAAESAFVDAFDRDPLDNAWAGKWEDTLEHDIRTALGEHRGFSDVRLECRSSHCIATVGWDSFDAATSQIGTASQVSRGACKTTTFMPPPDDPARNYTHRIRFKSCRDLDDA